jgi:hypothetical protein
MCHICLHSRHHVEESAEGVCKGGSGYGLAGIPGRNLQMPCLDDYQKQDTSAFRIQSERTSTP